MSSYSAYSMPSGAPGKKAGAAEVIPSRDKEELTEAEKVFSIDIAKYPFSGVAKRYERMKISGRHGNAIKESLLARGLIEEEGIRTKAGKIVLLKTTGKGMERAKKLGAQIKRCGRPASLEHEYWKEKVAQHMVRKGFKVEREKKIGGGRAID